MFSLIGDLWQTILMGIGTVFVSFGMALTGVSEPLSEPPVTAVQEEDVSELSVEMEESSRTSSVASISNTDVNSKSVVATLPATSATNIPLPIINDSFEIQGVKLTTNKDATTIVVTWQTTKQARSRMILDGQTYESEGGIGTDHKVAVTGLSPRTKYNYTITARTQDSNQLEDDHVGVYIPIPDFKEFTISFGSLVNDCREFVVSDAVGKTVSGVNLRISANYRTSSTSNLYSTGYKDIKSGANGIAKYCEGLVKYADTVYKVESEKTGNFTF